MRTFLNFWKSATFVWNSFVLQTWYAFVCSIFVNQVSRILSGLSERLSWVNLWSAFNCWIVQAKSARNVQRNFRALWKSRKGSLKQRMRLFVGLLDLVLLVILPKCNERSKNIQGKLTLWERTPRAVSSHISSMCGWGRSAYLIFLPPYWDIYVLKDFH